MGRASSPFFINDGLEARPTKASWLFFSLEVPKLGKSVQSVENDLFISIFTRMGFQMRTSGRRDRHDNSY
ncbi:hypothetical protein [Scytonema sp. NUACC26]|uniref:hypothetical protein n=1 Tax=Scytonema sp. NUACC26 TaxID=3140176 RepID=UPI0038B33DF6